MVEDPLRTRPLLRAVASVVKPGDTVLDIGTGLGILAIAAAKAGAKKIYAIDCDSAALREARLSAKKIGVIDRISFIESLSFDFKIPSRADVVLCETVGSFAFDENILAALLDAKHRLLKRGGRIAPEKIELWGAPICKIPTLSLPAEIGIVKRSDLLAKPLKLTSVDFSAKFSDEIHVKQKFKCTKNGPLRAFAVWPRVFWSKNEITDASPLKKSTHWKQGILVVEERKVATGKNIALEFIIRPNPTDPKRMTERLWKCPFEK